MNSSTNPRDLAERTNSGINPGDLVVRANSGTNHGNLVERVKSGTNPRGLTERVNSGTNPGDLAKRANSSTNLGDLAERTNSGTNPGDLAERANSGTNPEDFIERVNSGTNPGDLTERMHLGSNHRDLTERMHSGSNPGDLAERMRSGSNPGDLAKRMHLGSNPGDLVERTHTWVGMTSSDSSSSIRVVSSLRSGEASQCDPEVGSSGASSGPPSPVDARVLRDLEVMKVDHDLNTTVIEGSLAVIRERYSIPIEYGLHVPQPGQRPYSSDAPGMCISVDALEAGLRFPLHPLIEECLRWWRISPSQVAPNSWLSGAPSNNKSWKSRYLFVSGPVWRFRLDWSAHPIGNASPYLSEEESVLVGRLKGILSSSCAIKEMTELWLVEVGLGPASRGTAILPYFSFSSCLLTCKLGCGSDGSQRFARDAQGVWRQGPSNSPRYSGGRCFSRKGSPEGLIKEASRRTGRVGRRSHQATQEGQGADEEAQVPSRRGGVSLRSKGKEPTAPSEEPDTLAESEGGASPVHRRQRSMKNIFKTKVHKDDAGYYTLQMSDLGHQDPDKEMKARWRGLKNSTKVWNDLSVAEEFERGLLHPQLARELYTLPSEVLLA
ncbi:hypothetical protein GW17_00044486 [Ensete ventricosum]|nr:hypothetical protein GW17_00044486 [Ensete ventricosum]